MSCRSELFRWGATLLGITGTVAVSVAFAGDRVHLPLEPIWTSYQGGAHQPAQDSVERIPLLNGSITVDGYLDEPVWDEATVWRLDYEISLAENRSAPVETLVLLGVTDDALVFAFIAREPDMRAVRVTLTDRDQIWDDDRVSLVLDTFGDQRHAFEIYVNPWGIQADALRSEFPRERWRRRGRGEPGLDFNFDFLWESAARVYADGYIVEGRIPFRSLRFSANPQGEVVWRIGAFRDYPRDFPYRMSVVPWDFERRCFICQLPVVRLQIPARSGRPVQMIPYARSLYERMAVPEVDIDQTMATGLDVKFQPAPQWVLDATLNPDFSQVETDVFQITTNLRFAPFYPEKRPFFLERTDLFQTPLRVVYTRTVLDPLYGVRATGKTGPHTLAFMHLMDRSTYLIFPAVQRSRTVVLDEASLNTLFRYRYDLGTQSAIGVLITDKEFGEGGFNRVVGLDTNLYLSPTLLLSGQALVTTTRYPTAVAEAYGQPTDTLAGWAYWFQLERRGRTWEFQVNWQERTEDFRADLGFIQQVGTRDLGFRGAYILWPNARLIKRMSFFTFGRIQWERPGALQTRSLNVGTFIRAAGQTNVFFRIQAKRDRVGVVYFDTPRVTLGINLAPLSWFRGGVRVEVGSEPDLALVEKARFLQASINHQWLLWHRLEIRHELRYQRLAQDHLLQDAFIQFLRLTWQITPRWAFRQILQWQRFRFPDPRYRALKRPIRSMTLEAQSLLRYRVNYATAFYLGFYGRWSDIDTASTSRWNVFVKFAYLFNI